MKYVIKRRRRFENVYDNKTELYKAKEIIEYVIFRIGRLFGFWHKVGEEMIDSQDNVFSFPERLKSYEQA